MKPIIKDKNYNSTLRFFFITIFFIGVMIYLNSTFDVFNKKEDIGPIVYELIIILIISSALSFGKIGQKIKYLMIWILIFFICMTCYTYRFELSEFKEKILAEFIPEKGFQKDINTISFPVSSDGHYYIRASIDGIPIRFLVDTGASHIVLSPGDAEKIGFNFNELDFDKFYNTANGRVRGSSIRIANFKIGNYFLEEIGASVNEAQMRDSLLGMTFFNRLERYEVKDNVLTLFWNR